MRKGKTSKMRTRHKTRKRDDQRYRNLKAGNIKVCTHCLDPKAISDFDLQKDNKHKPQARRPYCRDCRKLKNAEAYKRKKHDT